MIPKFRAWHKEFKIMTVVQNISYLTGTKQFDLLHEDYADYIYADMTKIELMQWTGLQDKNGTEIFEGDVLTLKQKNYTRWANRVDIKVRDLRCVVSKNINFYLVFIPSALEMDESLDSITIAEYLFSEKYEPIVIGNIYENPELEE